MDTTSVILFFAAILILAGLILALVTLTKRGPKRLNVEYYRSHWLTIEQQLSRDEPSSCSLCILNADKLLDQAMRESGLTGTTMGDRLKASGKRFSNLNNVWSAHKIRNQIAHEPGFKVSYDDARRALATFKQALKEMGAI